MTEHLTDVVTEGGHGVENDRPTTEVAVREGVALATTWSRTTRRLVGILALVPVVLVAGALAGCTPTSGGTASVAPSSTSSSLSSLHFDAVSGRNNAISVSLGSSEGFVGPDSLLLTDSRNLVTPGSGCIRVNDNTVRCSIDATTSAGFVDQLIRLGDGNDTFASSVFLSQGTVVDAGAGDDTVNSGSKNVVDAGPGNDTVTGGGVVHAGTGNDTVKGGGGSDVFYEDSDALDIDSFSGGTGRDTIHYIGVLHAVNISLNDVADDGRPGEGDNVRSDIEDIGGSGFADTLTGDGDANKILPTDIFNNLDKVDLLPGDGGMVINGGGGNDEIWGSASETEGDRLWGGTGNDIIHAFAGDDTLSGGPGDDSLSGWDGFDALDGGSESDYCDVGSSAFPIDLIGGTAVNCETGP